MDSLFHMSLECVFTIILALSLKVTSRSPLLPFKVTGLFAVLDLVLFLFTLALALFLFLLALTLLFTLSLRLFLLLFLFPPLNLLSLIPVIFQPLNNLIQPQHQRLRRHSLALLCLQQEVDQIHQNRVLVGLLKLLLGLLQQLQIEAHVLKIVEIAGLHQQSALQHHHAHCEDVDSERVDLDGLGLVHVTVEEERGQVQTLALSDVDDLDLFRGNCHAQSVRDLVVELRTLVHIHGFFFRVLRRLVHHDVFRSWVIPDSNICVGSERARSEPPSYSNSHLRIPGFIVVI